MKIRRVAWLPFRLPFATPFVTSSGSETARDGLLLRCETVDGLVGLGEASPVPAFGSGTLADTEPLVVALAPRFLDLHLDQADALLAGLDLDVPGAAAAVCAFDTALLDLRARHAGLPLSRLLGSTSDAPLPVNATLGGYAPLEAARAAIAAGFRCLKLKVGLASDRDPLKTSRDPKPNAWERSRLGRPRRPRAPTGVTSKPRPPDLSVSDQAEVERIAAIRAAFGPAVRLRLDANGAWNADQAIAILRAVEPYAIELVEQPVPAADLAGLARVRAAVGVPIAADESVGTPDQARRVIEAGAADLLVVKPMLAGGPRPALAILKLARAAGLGAIVTTTIDSGVATAMALHLAATLPPPRPACGLATARLLVGDLVLDAPVVCDGAMRPPAAPGLGVGLDPAQLARFGRGWQEVVG